MFARKIVVNSSTCDISFHDGTEVKIEANGDVLIDNCRSEGLDGKLNGEQFEFIVGERTRFFERNAEDMKQQS